jgi:hypothetical protein
MFRGYMHEVIRKCPVLERKKKKGKREFRSEQSADI